MSGWVHQESGWYTREGVGGVSQERDRKWWFWPEPTTTPAQGPFKTAAEAMAHADEWAPRRRAHSPASVAEGDAE